MSRPKPMCPAPTMSRRRFLRDLGVSAAAVPLLVGLDSLYAKAQVPVVPKKRFVFMYSPNGILYSAWRIPQPGASLDIADGTLLNDPARTLQPLSSNAGKLLVLDRLSLIGARPVYNDPTTTALTINGTTVQPSSVDGIPHPGGDQKGMGNLLTGQVLIGGENNFGSAGLGNGISVDQVIANQLFKGRVRFPSLQLAVMGTNDLYAYSDREVEKVLSYSAPANPLVPVSDPFVLYNLLFGNPTMAQTAANLRLLMDKTVLDGVQADFARIQPKVSSADWQILQQHQQSVRDIEGQLTAAAVASCAAPTGPAAPAGVDITNPAATLSWTEIPGVTPISGKMLIDLMVQALACGLTNVVTFQWAHAEDNLTYPWVNNGAGLPPSQCGLSGVGQHNMAHERDPNLIFIDQWYASQFNYMVTQLDGIPESGMPGTSVLDNSLLMHTSEVSDAASHISDNMAITLAGSNGGYFKQGQALRFNSVFTPLAIPPNSAPNSYFLTDEWYTTAVQAAAQDQATVSGPDLSNNDLMASILDSFGLDITEVAPSIADPRFFHGLLPGVRAGS
jgi:Protein of unknown function (DUF1552)